MKIKLDYQTNSSSSSYCIYGSILDLNDFATVLGVKEVEEGWTADVDVDEVFELLEDMRGLEYQHLDGEWLVGLSPEAMKDDETLGAFKQRVVEELFKQLKISKTVKDIHLEFGEVYDG